jgi:septal ring factor EnvC (AmiA/AmiB activator)
MLQWLNFLLSNKQRPMPEMPSIRQMIATIGAALLLSAPFAMHVSAAQPDPAQLGHDQAELDGLEGEISSIGDRLKQLDGQAANARAQRDQAQRQIAALAAKSQALLPQIEAQTADYARKKQALKEAIAQDYQRQQPGAVMMLAESGSVSETMVRAKYRTMVSEHVDSLAKAAEASAEKLRQQKEDFDSQKQDAELATQQLQQISASVATQEAEGKELLANRSNEAAYVAERVEQAKAAQAKLLNETGGNAMWGKYSNGSTVKAGDVIGFEGSTGNSTGCHTHFSTIKNGQWVNPGAYIGNAVNRPAGRQTQGYGMTDWARSGAYGGSIHNGMDFVQGCGKPVRAAADGTIIRDTRGDNSGFGHYVMIRHASGLVTLYGHLI